VLTPLAYSLTPARWRDRRRRDRDAAVPAPTAPGRSVGGMAQPITASELHGRDDLPDWRALLRRMEGTFSAPDFPAAARFVERVAAAAEAAGHHPDLDLRYPARVHVVLVTHDTGGLTDADADLAGTISRLAAEAGLTSEPRAARAVEVAIDALDIDAVRPFWRAVLAYEDEPTPEGEQVVAVVDPQRIGPPVWFQQMDAPRPQRNRIHIDVTVPHDVAEQRVADAVAAGGRVVSDAAARAFWVLADPEGNEACVCTWQDRD
jgi:4a-hydroxytetrahydrobiopterin dehydratase